MNTNENWAQYKRKGLSEMRAFIEGEEDITAYENPTKSKEIG